MEERLDREDAHAVGNEGWRVLAEHALFAQDALPVCGEEVQNFGKGVRPGNDFEQLQVTRWVEEVGAAEVLAEIFAASFGKHANGDAAGVGRDERARFPMLFDAFKQLLLDVKPFHNHLNDPVAFGNARKVVVKIAGFDSSGEPLAVNGRRLGLEGLGQVASRHSVSRSFL